MALYIVSLIDQSVRVVCSSVQSSRASLCVCRTKTGQYMILYRSISRTDQLTWTTNDDRYTPAAGTPTRSPV
jgi:hypothetical protein